MDVLEKQFKTWLREHKLLEKNKCIINEDLVAGFGEGIYDDELGDDGYDEIDHEDDEEEMKEDKGEQDDDEEAKNAHVDKIYIKSLLKKFRSNLIEVVVIEDTRKKSKEIKYFHFLILDK